ncbi:hypothetical protein G9P44_003793 [Scheffersomyces stipitis]|nr:hypothetical protein G9P44_003793 [Scheffersomyces stipitis]
MPLCNVIDYMHLEKWTEKNEVDPTLFATSQLPMCGILCSITPNYLSFTVPSCFPELNVRSPSGVFPETHFWESNDSTEIEKFIQNDHILQPLSESDIKKLNNVEKLRDLHGIISKIKNNVKLAKLEKNAQLQQIQNQIDELTIGEKEDSPELENMDIFESLVYKVSSRGPDYLNYTQFKNSNWNYRTFSSVLSLRQPFQSQPVQRDRFILQFNGELYNEQCLQGNDTSFIMNTLQDKLKCDSDDERAVLATLSELTGEFAIVLNDIKHNVVYFGRDCVGRRALSYSLEDSGLTISSLSDSTLIECANMIYKVDLNNLELRTFLYSEMFEEYSNDKSLHFSPLNYDVCANENSALDKVYCCLKNSTLVRQEAIYPLHHNESATLAILFSGGLDCSVIAGLICENILEKNHHNRYNVDLLTVGFDNPRTNQDASSSPDRELSKKSWFHIASKYNDVTLLNIRLVEINVSYKDWLLHRHRVRNLMYPCNTEMDMSIAIAFYFASANIGCMEMVELTRNDVSYEEFLKNECQYIKRDSEYKSTAKVLFSGLGADELFAGYSRHEAIFSTLITPESSEEQISECYKQLSSELVHDIDIIHRRNLGRDDRVISSWGKELRYPYLDEKFISMVINEIEPNFKFTYSFESVTSKKKKEPRIVMKPIRKYILRQLASRLGLEWVRNEAKRAIQFGAKSAKLEIGQSKIKGIDIIEL